MASLDDFRRLLTPVFNKVFNLVGRAVIKKVDDEKKLQELQVSLLADEVRDEVEHFQQYGFTSNPDVGAEAVVVCVNGSREHALAIAVDDRRYRIRNLGSGEVAVYSKHGATIVLKQNGDVEVTPKSGSKIRLAGDVAVTGTLEASGDVKAGAISLQGHTHAMTPENSPISVAGAVGTISGTTGAAS